MYLEESIVIMMAFHFELFAWELFYLFIYFNQVLCSLLQLFQREIMAFRFVSSKIISRNIALERKYLMFHEKVYKALEKS